MGDELSNNNKSDDAAGNFNKNSCNNKFVSINSNPNNSNNLNI